MISKRWAMVLSAIGLTGWCAAAYASWTPIDDINSIYSHGGYHFIESDITTNACGTAGKFYWETSNPDAPDMLAIALTALAADKQIRVSGNFTNPTCYLGGAKVDYIMISK